MRSYIWKFSEGKAWMRWPRYYYCNGLGTQNMKGPCHSGVFNNKSLGADPPISKTSRKSAETWAWASEVCQESSRVRGRAISHSACLGLLWCILGPWPSHFKTKRTSIWITAIHHCRVAFSCCWHTVLILWSFCLYNFWRFPGKAVSLYIMVIGLFLEPRNWELFMINRYPHLLPLSLFKDHF